MRLIEERLAGRNNEVKGQKQGSGAVCMFHQQPDAKDKEGGVKVKVKEVGSNHIVDNLEY